MDPLQHFTLRSLSENCIKTLKSGKFWNFCLFRCQFATFFIRKTNYLFLKAYWTTNLCHFELFQHSSSRSLSKISLKLYKNAENREFFGFLTFSVSIRDLFHLKNSNYIFIKAYWTTNLCHVERFQHSSPRSLSKF